MLQNCKLSTKPLRERLVVSHNYSIVDPVSTMQWNGGFSLISTYSRMHVKYRRDLHWTRTNFDGRRVRRLRTILTTVEKLFMRHSTSRNFLGTFGLQMSASAAYRSSRQNLVKLVDQPAVCCSRCPSSQPEREFVNGANVERIKAGWEIETESGMRMGSSIFGNCRESRNNLIVVRVDSTRWIIFPLSTI
jgi:hypothetical protein